MFKIQVLISGRGSTLKNIAEQCNPDGCLFGLVKIERVVANRDCPGLEIAKEFNLETAVFRPKDYSSVEEWSEKLLDLDVDLHVMGGFLKKIHVPDRWKDRILNIHPAINHVYCGEGMYGIRVHEAVVAAGERITGCTVHIVDNWYDKGRIIAQEKVAILDNETAEEVQENVQRRECLLYPRAILNYLKTLKRDN